MTPAGMWTYVDLPPSGYADVHDLQLRLVQARSQGILEGDTVLWLTHDPVFTLGRRGGEAYLKIAPKMLAEKGVPLIRTERGGLITYHGPGQLVAYLIVNLDQLRMDLTGFVSRIEAIMLRTAEDFGIRAQRSDRNRGIFAGHRKLGSIGVAMRRGITFHGLALNVDMDLTPFEWISPCGLEGVQATSMAALCGSKLDFAMVRAAAQAHTARMFKHAYRRLTRTELEDIIADCKAPDIPETPLA